MAGFTRAVITRARWGRRRVERSDEGSGDRPVFDYAQLYEHHAQLHADADAVGVGDFDLIGQQELDALQRAGLQPDHALLDFGCGIGRLGQYAIPFLSSGRYTGLDISPTMIRRARELCDPIDSTCEVSWVVQTDEYFAFPPDRFDMICGFSVFTHMDHEDMFRYLQAALPITKPGGVFLFSCLPIDTPTGAQFFLHSAHLTLEERWREIRCVGTSKDFVISIAELAGWRLVEWRTPAGEGQSVCVVERPASG